MDKNLTRSQFEDDGLDESLQEASKSLAEVHRCQEAVDVVKSQALHALETALRIMQERVRFLCELRERSRADITDPATNLRNVERGSGNVWVFKCSGRPHCQTFDRRMFLIEVLDFVRSRGDAGVTAREILNVLGASRARVDRALQSLKRQGFVRLARERIAERMRVVEFSEMAGGFDS